jgi:hypothetical protein
MRNKIVTLFLLISFLFLSSCSPLGIRSLFPFSTKYDPYQINTFPISGKYTEIIGSNDNKICYYSYDVDGSYNIIQKNLEIFEFNFRSLQQKTIYSLPTANKNYLEFQRTIIGISYNQLEEPIFFHQTLENGISSIYSVYYKQEHLLYSQKSNTLPVYTSFFYKPNNRILFNYLILVYPLGNDKMKVVVDSIENKHLITFDIPNVEFNWYETNNHIWFFSKTTNNSNILYKIDKQTFTFAKVAEYVSGKIVGIDFKDDYILINNETKNTIEIVNSNGIAGSLSYNFPQENINFVISRKFQNYYSIFILLRTTMDGIDTTIPWIQYYPKNKKNIQKMLKLPAEYEIFTSKYYERKNDEFIATVMKQETHEMNLIFFYFKKGIITFEPLHHRIDNNMTIEHFTYLPGYYFTWSEYTKLEKYADYNYQVYYCSLNRLQAVVDLITKKP